MALPEEASARLDALAQASAGVRLLESIPGVGPRTAVTPTGHGRMPNRMGGAAQPDTWAGTTDRTSTVPQPAQLNATRTRDPTKGIPQCQRRGSGEEEGKQPGGGDTPTASLESWLSFAGDAGQLRKFATLPGCRRERPGC